MVTLYVTIKQAKFSSKDKKNSGEKDESSFRKL
jgi:hypothetical protein